MEKIKQETIKRQEEYGEKYEAIIAACNELLAALGTYRHKIIDKRFFEQYFTEKGEYRSWTRYTLSKPTYSWQKGYRLRLGSLQEDIEVADRTKESVRVAIETKREHVVEWLKENNKKKEALEKVDEKKLRADIIAVFNKHGKPSIWRDVLDSYEIKYPEDK